VETVILEKPYLGQTARDGSGPVIRRFDENETHPPAHDGVKVAVELPQDAVELALRGEVLALQLVKWGGHH
jgi:hypothetical protein